MVAIERDKYQQQLDESSRFTYEGYYPFRVQRREKESK